VALPPNPAAFAWPGGMSLATSSPKNQFGILSLLAYRVLTLKELEQARGFSRKVQIGFLRRRVL
jgi:hypothetical protein